ncbi:MAG: glycosyltransferase, partial [Myxococcaceae bacterium]
MLRAAALPAFGLSRVSLRAAADAEAFLIVRTGDTQQLVGRIDETERELVFFALLDEGAVPELLLSTTAKSVSVSSLTVAPVSPTTVARLALLRGIEGTPNLSALRANWDGARHALLHPAGRSDPYDIWRTLNAADPVAQRNELARMGRLPTISVIVPVYDAPKELLAACIESVLGQLYPHWELCLADDASTDPSVRQLLEEYARRDARVRVAFREKNGHISAASNTALELATGEFVALLDQDDELTADALFEIASALNRHPDADVLYSDEDKRAPEGRLISPRFKPGWSPDLLLSQMYLGHLCVYRRA